MEEQGEWRAGFVCARYRLLRPGEEGEARDGSRRCGGVEKGPHGSGSGERRWCCSVGEQVLDSHKKDLFTSSLRGLAYWKVFIAHEYGKIRPILTRVLKPLKHFGDREDQPMHFSWLILASVHGIIESNGAPMASNRQPEQCRLHRPHHPL